MTDPWIGRILDRRYRLKREIASGGSGRIFEAVHEVTKRSVAVKLLRAEWRAKEEARERLLTEARTATALRHPGIVDVLDACTLEEDGPIVVMELLEGRPLDGLLAARGQLRVDEVAHLGRQLCDTLAFIHARGVVHRDIKPGNVFVTKDELGRERLKILDFGIALVPVSLRDDRPRWTRQGQALGTVEYMAPEQILGQLDVDRRSDIYAVGVLLFECLTGEVPYTGTPVAIMMKATDTEAPPSLRARRPDVSPALAAAIERAIARDPSRRYEDATGFAHAIIQASGLAEGWLDLLAPSAPVPGLRTHVAERATTPFDTETSQRRRHRRAPYLTPVRCVLPDRSVVDGRSEDLSEGGVLIVAALPIEKGTLVHVRFALPTTGEIASVGAACRWVRPARGRSALGLEFDALPAAVRDSIASYVTAMCGSE